MKKVVTMQDISCVGKCSLTVALPVLSSLGVETCVIPTAVLSFHTMFKDFTFHDLTGEIELILNAWEKEDFQFEGIYTGYLGSFEQLNLARDLFKRFGKGKVKLVDPCMADNGKLYTGFTLEFAKEMANLCAEADIICPNLTEASFLLDIPYETEYDEAYVQDVLKKLTALGCSKAILTGISLEEGKLGAYAYDAESDTFDTYFTDEESEHFHGTGDIWASAFFGTYIQTADFHKSLKVACDYVRESIAITLAEPNHNTYGVNFEEAIPSLVKAYQ